jgi:hypothetical protein
MRTAPVPILLSLSPVVINSNTDKLIHKTALQKELGWLI